MSEKWVKDTDGGARCGHCSSSRYVMWCAHCHRKRACPRCMTDLSGAEACPVTECGWTEAWQREQMVKATTYGPPKDEQG